MASIMEAAAKAASEGWRVFPCQDNKAPLPGFRWREEAATWPSMTQDVRWPDAPLYGIALPEGVCVIDLDVGPSGSLKEAFENLEAAGHDYVRSHALFAFWGEPRTYAVNTRSGGLHLYFYLPHVGPWSQTALCPLVDVRIGGLGYVIGPGSPGYAEEVPGLPMLHLPAGILTPARPKRLRDRRDPSA